MKAYVTGASGHLGHLLVRALLHAGHDVRALVHDRPLRLDVTQVRCDVRDAAAVRDALRDADVVFHLAAKISLQARDADRMMATQVEGTRNVVGSRPRRLIHVASIHAYDPMPLDEPVNELRPLATDTRHFAYDRSKALGAQLVLDAIRDGLDAVLVSPTALLGPEDHGPSEIGALFRRLLRRELPGLVDASFDWVDARDVAAQLVALVTGATGHYILPGHRASLVELGRNVCELGRVQPPRMTSPLWLAKATVPFATGWARLTKTEPLYTHASLATLGHYRAVDGAHAARELGWAPRPLHDTLADTVAWWMSQK